MRRMIAASVARRIALKKMGAGALALATPMQVLAAVSDAGKPVVKARRIVSVGGALTEIVYALGAQGELWWASIPRRFIRPWRNSCRKWAMRAPCRPRVCCRLRQRS